MAAILVMLMITLTNLAVSNPVYSPYPTSNVEGVAPANRPPSSRGFHCIVLERPGPCASTPSWKQGVTLPNLYGHHTVDQALAELGTVLDSLSLVGGDSSAGRGLVTQFLCTLYLPPCPRVEKGPRGAGGQTGGGGGVGALPPPLPLPCRPLCEMARGEVRGGVQSGPSSAKWPSDVRCHMFPTENCFALAGPGDVKYVTKALVASGTSVRMHDVIPQSVAPLESELGDDDPYDVQVVTLGSNHIPPRRYDLSDLGDPTYFQGWADVQGTGAANDYCRVIGKGKRRFLSCALAGTRGQDHQYVSKLGFEPGHPGTWFMRDVDSDGRDDYCRCMGETSTSRVVCMKAGEKGFYGSTVQGGSENTFELPRTGGCHHKHLNPHFGL
ncbi:uncharacterized protein LOC143293611 [Babylonia areolata]|uniref:uncharacterized protein LOC143293611 n=1 Tax=Babylonia areolata TaxID=304850 RepID=UPI003FD399AE